GVGLRGDAAEGRVAHVCLDTSKDDAIERVEELSSERQASIFRQREPLQESEVLVQESGVAEVRVGARCRAEAKCGWHRKGCRVDPQIASGVEVLDLRSAVHARHYIGPEHCVKQRQTV